VTRLHRERDLQPVIARLSEVDQARVETAIPWSRSHHLGHQANSLTPNLWHFAIILPKERRETADSSESGQVFSEHTRVKPDSPGQGRTVKSRTLIP